MSARARSAITLLREAFRNDDGAEAESVILVCNELEKRLNGEDALEKAKQDIAESAGVNWDRGRL